MACCLGFSISMKPPKKEHVVSIQFQTNITFQFCSLFFWYKKGNYKTFFLYFKNDFAM